MDVQIRAASPDDAERLASLTRQLGYESDGAAARERLERLLKSDRDSILVAEIDGTVAAWMHLVLASSLESDDYAEIRGLVVGEGFRSGGIGARLIAAADEWARERAVARIRVRSNVIREDAHRFYERHGFRVVKQQAVLDKDLA